MKRFVKCPSCDSRKSVSSNIPPLSIELELERRGLSPWWAKPEWSLWSGHNPVRWACTQCLESGRAIPADPSRQLFCDWPPYLAYFDIGHRCSDCGEKFVFTKHEQRFWYEELGFWVQSRPKQCAACRQKRRTTTVANTRLQHAIAELDPQNSEHLAKVSQLYLDVGSRAKAIEFLRRAANRAQNDQQRDAFREAIAKIESESPDDE